MNKRNLMTQAHKIAKSIVAAVGDYMIAMKIALKKTWGEAIMKNTQTVEYTVPAGVELTVTRPNGETQTLTHPTLKSITDIQFAQIQRDTKTAGRGTVTSYRNIKQTKTKVIKLSEADKSVMSSERVKSAMTLNGGTY